MSGTSSIRGSLRRSPTADTTRWEHQISIVDQERSAELAEIDEDAELSESEAAATPSTPRPSPLTKRLTGNSVRVQQSIRREWTKRKYAKYNQNRYDLELPPDEDPASQPQIGEAATPAQTSYLERGRAKAKAILKRRRTLGAGRDNDDAVVDILYENQRGAFFFGVPKYSSSSLLPSDPKPWQNAHFHTSPVDIRNAQVPDPSWEWAWKSWYVDMSRDVDDEGWEYSFQFSGGFAWHGNHPWFHSFVRRRRWLRMRRRRDMHHRTKEKAHEFTAEYFTIHPKTLRPGSEDMSRFGESEMARLLRERKREEAVDVHNMEIPDIGSLILALKKSAIDREKLVAVRKFIKEGGDELFYLSDRMPEIMSLFVFQSSRRQLLSELLNYYDDTHKQQEKLTEHTHEDDEAGAQRTHDARARHAENLMNAVHAADEQVKKLEYWSDIKSMAQGGDTLEKNEGGHWDSSKWQGLSSTVGAEHPEHSFPNKQDATEGVLDLHPHPEDLPAEKEKETETTPDDGDDKLERKKSPIWYDAKETSEDTGTYTTAAESASQLSRRNKGKSKANTLDGADDEPAAGTAAAQNRLPDVSPPSRAPSVQILEPDPEPPEDPDTASSTLGDAVMGVDGPIKENLKDAAQDAKDAAKEAKETVKQAIKPNGDGS